MYRRPFQVGDKSRLKPYATGPALPVIGRHPMPSDREAVKPVVRFVAQAMILATVTVVFATWMRHLLPTASVLLFGACSFMLFVLSLLKWLWGTRVSGLPLFTATVIGVGVLCLLGSALGRAGAGLLVTLVIGAYLLVALVSVARAADSATMWQGWQMTLSIALGALVMLAVALIPHTLTAVTCLVAGTMCANWIFATAVALVYVEYVLANPIHPQQTVEAARTRWRRILRMQALFAVPPQGSPIAACVLTCAAVIGIAVLVPDWGVAINRVGEIAAAAPGTEARGRSATDDYLKWGMVVAFVIVIAQPLMDYRRRGRIIWRAVAVWMLYGDRWQPAPGIYRPRGWLASARVRQAIVAALLFSNVLILHLGVPPETVALECVRRLAASAADHTYERMALACYALMMALPILLPLAVFPRCIDPKVQAIHDHIETAEPLDLYPSTHSGDRR